MLWAVLMGPGWMIYTISHWRRANSVAWQQEVISTMMAVFSLKGGARQQVRHLALCKQYRLICLLIKWARVFIIKTRCRVQRMPQANGITTDFWGRKFLCYKSKFKSWRNYWIRRSRRMMIVQCAFLGRSTLCFWSVDTVRCVTNVPRILFCISLKVSSLRSVLCVGSR